MIASFFVDEVTGRIADQNLSPHTWRTQNHEQSQSRLKAGLFWTCRADRKIRNCGDWFFRAHSLWLNSASATTAQQLCFSTHASATTDQQLGFSNHDSATTAQQPRLSNHVSATKLGSRFSNYASATKTNSRFSNHASATKIYSRFSNQTSATKTHPLLASTYKVTSYT